MATLGNQSVLAIENFLIVRTKVLTSGVHIMFVRYPHDRYDRIWKMHEHDPSWTIVPDIINGTVKNYPNDTYGAPSAVMRSVATPMNNSGSMAVGWINYMIKSLSVLYVLYFTEVETLQENEFREFNIYLNDIPLVSAFRPEQMLTTVVTGTMQDNDTHYVYLEPTSNSKPPLISAMEIYWIRPVDGSATYSGDGKYYSLRSKSLCLF
jgi:hypothetical protein